MSEEFPPTSRIVLNANRGVSNFIDYSVIKGDLLGVAKKLFDILADHYGPFSSFAAIGSNDLLKDTKFTKDGINIVRAISFASPQEDWFRKTVQFIGRKMEVEVGDGTTSAMMFACATLWRMIDKLDMIRPVAFSQLKASYDKLVSLVKSKIEAASFGPFVNGEVDTDRVRAIVYNQTYTSSHGNTDLANALADLYAKTPSELWDRMIYECLNYETETPFEVIESFGQYQMPAEVFTNTMLNQDFSTWFKSEDCTLVILHNHIVSSSPEWEDLKKIVEEKATDTHPVVIVCHNGQDINTYQTINDSLVQWTRANKKVVIFQNKSADENPSVNDFVTLQLLMGDDITKTRFNRIKQIEGAKVKWRNKLLEFDDLYEVPEKYKSELKRFQFLDGEHHQFMDYLESVKNYADSFASLPVNTENRKKTNLMCRMYAKLVYNKVYTLRIGGSAHDNLAFEDVADDCIRASSRALKYGVVLGNNKTLRYVLQDIRNNTGDDLDLAWLCHQMIAALNDIAWSTHNYLTKFKDDAQRHNYNQWWYGTNVDFLTFDRSVDYTKQNYFKYPWTAPGSLPLFDGQMDAPPFSPELCSKFIGETLLAKKALITQPARTDISMLERFAEVALKYVLTSRVIMPGSAYVDDSKEPKK